jgi:hypothetical protein
MSVTLYCDNKEKSRFDVRFTSETKLQQDVAAECRRRYIPVQNVPVQNGNFFVTRAGWINGQYVMALGYFFRAGGLDW